MQFGMKRDSRSNLHPLRWVVAIVCCLLAPIGAAESISTQNGLVSGTREEGLTVYRGIPFAAPPVGELRWRAPQPAANWSGVKAADQFGPSCMQASRANALLGTPELTVSEDCLYLNVWSPAQSSKDNLPVMVWIYGGGFMSGSTAMPIYSGEQLAKKGVVVVSAAYRVGPFGFFSHPDLSAESQRLNGQRVSGNYGLLDQIAALEWVRKNIAAFGGDPKRVTIFGESAGGISVSMLAASPLAKGLFHGAISQSGGSFGPTRTPAEPGENIATLIDAERAGGEFAKQMGASSIADLRKLPAADVLKSAGRLGMSWPVLDGWVIPGDQYNLYAAGRYHDTPILIGTNSDEGALFGAAANREAYEAAVHKRFGPHADALLKKYPATANEWLQSNRDLTRDAAFGWHTLAWARLQTRTGKSPVYLYYFNHKPPRAETSPLKNAVGAIHAEELIYVFGHLDQRKLPWTESDRLISDAMVSYWTNFAKRGDPNGVNGGANMPKWPQFSATKMETLHFNAAPEAGVAPNVDKIDALDAYFAWRRTPAGAAWAQRARE